MHAHCLFFPTENWNIETNYTVSVPSTSGTLSDTMAAQGPSLQEPHMGQKPGKAPVEAKGSFNCIEIYLSMHI